jgi:large subunit ribosomal protein L18Ae
MPEPTLYRIRVFARDEVLARSKYWYHMKRQHKIRRIQGEIVSTSQIFEKRAGVMRNYGIFLRYDARTTTVNMYKEFRDVTLCGAVSQLYMEMSGRHSGRGETLQIIKTSIVADADAVREKTVQFAKGGVVFPKTRTVKRAPTAALKTVFKADRPTLF